MAGLGDCRAKPLRWRAAHTQRLAELTKGGTTSRWADKLMDRIVDGHAEALGVRRQCGCGCFCEKAIQEVIVVAALCVKRNWAVDDDAPTQKAASLRQHASSPAAQRMDACMLSRFVWPVRPLGALELYA